VPESQKQKIWSVSQPVVDSFSNCPHFGTMCKTG